jgi:regulator of nonsense transcripts 1
VKPQQINRLEDMWKEKPLADIKDLEVIQPEVKQ